MSGNRDASSTSTERPWRAAYLRSRELEQRFSSADPPQHAFRSLLNAARRGRRAFDRALEAHHTPRRHRHSRDRVPELPAALSDEFVHLADLKSSYNINTADFVFEDVYHLAFEKLGSWRAYGMSIPSAEDCGRLYRGQNVDEWSVGASIYRHLANGTARTAELRNRASAASKAASTIARDLDLPFPQAMAVAQHYSKYLSVTTWLLDFTRDPWVALFFASYEGKAGQVGIVWNLFPKEFAQQASGHSNPVGPLQLVVPRKIPRIENQAGVFVIAGQPELLDQYVMSGWETRFRQHDGLTFEDPALGVSRRRVYPLKDEILSRIARHRRSGHNCQEDPNQDDWEVPAAVFTDPSDPTTYEGILVCWLEEAAKHEPDLRMLSGMQSEMCLLGRFHALLQSPDHNGRVPDVIARSLHRLESAFGELCSQARKKELLSAREAIYRSYFEHASLVGSRSALHAALLEAEGEPRTAPAPDRVMPSKNLTRAP